MILTDDGKLQIVAPTGQRVTFTRKNLVETIAKHQAEVDKWTAYLNALDSATHE